MSNKFHVTLCDYNEIIFTGEIKSLQVNFTGLFKDKLESLYSTPSKHCTSLNAKQVT